MKTLLRLAIVSGAALLVGGCASGPQLRMTAQRPPVDQSVLAPELSKARIRRVVVLPPQGSPRGLYDGIIAMFERELLQHGMQLLSFESVVKRGGKVPLAEAPDAVLEISDWRWSKDLSPQRFFIWDETTGNEYKEVGPSVYQGTNTYKVAFPARELRFLGKLTDASTGELLATFDVRCPLNFNLPAHYVATVDIVEDKPVLTSESFQYASSNWIEDARKVSEGAIIRTVVNRLPKGKQEPSPRDTASGNAGAAPPADAE